MNNFLFHTMSTCQVAQVTLFDKVLFICNRAETDGNDNVSAQVDTLGLPQNKTHRNKYISRMQ